MNHCECFDKGCPAHLGVSGCDSPVEYRVSRIDMDGGPIGVCEWCMEDMMASGLFTIDQALCG